jgi:dTDP-4-amino-4,6-dideoxygalactose transaminase
MSAARATAHEAAVAGVAVDSNATPELPAVAGGQPMRLMDLPYGFHSLGGEEEREVVETLRHGWLTMGPRTAAFEQAVARYVGAPHAVAVSSASAALHLSLLALDLGPGDEVITTPLTFVATANAILHIGATPVFADVDPQTLTLDPEQAARRMTRRTRAILPVHYAGQPCDLPALERLARRRGVRLVEDASHAIGASVNGRRIGSIGDLTCFSFHPVKNMTTAEGGLVTTRSRRLARRIASLRFHGFEDTYFTRTGQERFRYPRMRALGFKYVMTDLQAAIGLHQLSRLERFNARRAALAQAYSEAFRGLRELRCPAARPGAVSAWHLYPIRLHLGSLRCTRDRFLHALRCERIQAGVHYLPVHLHPYYVKRFGFRRGAFPEAEGAARELMSLPLFPAMRDEDQRDVVRAVMRLVAYFRRSR